MRFYFVQMVGEIIDGCFVGALRFREPAFAVVEAQNTVINLSRGGCYYLLNAIIDVIVHPFIGKINFSTEVLGVQVYMAVFLR